MSHFLRFSSPRLGILATVLLVSQSATGETIFSWQAADGSTTFSDRPPFDATHITIRKLSNPLSSTLEFRVIETRHSDKVPSKSFNNDSHRNLPPLCEPKPAIPP